ncbi:MAG: YicC family protein, partial [Dysgonamonadaceae bacterium]|nr:YicC family protein [Dysgonamonadaceae bacterium]
TIYREKEIEIRNLLSQTIERGKVDFTIYLENTDAYVSSKINSGAVKAYFEQIKETSRILGVDIPADWFSLILRLPDAVKTELTELDEREWRVLKKTVQEALNAFTSFRKQEGRMLEKVFLNKISAIAQLLENIEQYDSERLEKIKIRMDEALRKFDSVSYDENRFEQELIYYIERLDVSEEKSRLDNHLRYFIETMETEKSQGRKLGFITQEMGREINTLGSKSNHAEMQKMVVQMKDELEQIKEQILNVL